MPTQDDYAAALKEIASGMFVSPEQAPEKIVEQVLRAYQIAQEACAQYTLWVSAQLKPAEKAEAALAAATAALEEYACEEVRQDRRGVARRALAKIQEMQGESRE